MIKELQSTYEQGNSPLINDSPNSSHLQKILFACGSIPAAVSYKQLSMYLNYYYSQSGVLSESTLEISQTLMQILKFSYAIVPIIAYIIIGYLSDISRSKFGRRIPFMFIGAISSSILFILFWLVPKNLSVNLLQIYMGILSALWSLSIVVFYGPYIALFPTIARTSRERIIFVIYFAVVGFIIVSIYSIFAPIVISRFSGIFWSICVGFINLILMLIAITVAFKFDKANTVNLKFPRFLTSIRDITKNRNFVFFVLFICCWSFPAILILKINTGYFLNLMKTNPRFYSMLITFISILPIPFVLFACFKYSWVTVIRRLILLTFVLFIISFLMQKFVAADTNNLLSGVLMTGFGICLFPTMLISLLRNPIIANFLDQDIENSGYQRAGLFYGITISMTTAASQLAILFNTLIFSLSNYIEGNKFGYTYGIFILLSITLTFFMFSKSSLGKMDINSKI